MGPYQLSSVVLHFAYLETEGGHLVEEEVGFGVVFVETGRGFLEAGGVGFGGGVGRIIG